MILTGCQPSRSVPVWRRTNGTELNRARAAFAVCLLVALYFAYTAAVGAIRSHQLSEDEAAAREELVQLRDQKAYLEAVLEYVSSDAYVEQEARRELGYVRDGEVPFVVTSPPPEEQQTSGGTWWERLFPR